MRRVPDRCHFAIRASKQQILRIRRAIVDSRIQIAYAIARIDDSRRLLAPVTLDAGGRRETPKRSGYDDSVGVA